MKKLLLIIAIVLLSFTMAQAEDAVITFAWDEPTDLDIIEKWEVHLSETTGGPYTKAAEIPKITVAPFQAISTMDIIGPPGSIQTRYAVLQACGTVQEAGQPTYKCSDNSNETDFSVTIPALEFSAPVLFRVVGQQ